MSKVFGVMVGTVREVKDTQGEGRVRVEFPWMGGRNVSYWAPVASLMAGKGRGTWFMPEVGDEVLVAFDQGDVNHPFVVGFLWNGEDKPPFPDTRERAIKSKNGHAIRMLDTTVTGGSAGALVIEDAHGNRITLSNGKVRVESKYLVEIHAPQISLGGPGWRRVVVQNSNPI